MEVSNQTLLIVILLCFMYVVLVSGFFMYWAVKREMRENSERKPLDKTHTNNDDYKNK